MENQNNHNTEEKFFVQDENHRESSSKETRSKPLQLLFFAFITAGLLLLTIFMYLTNISG